MAVNKEAYKKIAGECEAKNVQLVAVSKTKPAEDIRELYDSGQLDFGENYVQELVEKQLQLPADINWHFIGHLQSNKIKYIIPFVHLIHGADSFKLLTAISKQAVKHNREIDCLLQVHIAQEETKFGFDEKELEIFMNPYSGELSELKNVRICGLMGMASFTNDTEKVRSEYKYLKSLFDKYAELQTANFQLRTLSMGMSGDYKIAIEEGSTMVRIGSLIFGERAAKT
jgi:pyridoxal phosphate enzyme (YggS family)